MLNVGDRVRVKAIFLEGGEEATGVEVGDIGTIESWDEYNEVYYIVLDKDDENEFYFESRELEII